jgi:hypothetical protein
MQSKKNSLGKNFEKLIKRSIIENFHGEWREGDDKLPPEWDEDEDEDNKELSKRNWPFFTGLLIFYITFLVSIHFIFNP